MNAHTNNQLDAFKFPCPSSSTLYRSLAGLVYGHICLPGQQYMSPYHCYRGAIKGAYHGDTIAPEERLIGSQSFISNKLILRFPVNHREYISVEKDFLFMQSVPASDILSSFRQQVVCQCLTVSPSAPHILKQAFSIFAPTISSPLSSLAHLNLAIDFSSLPPSRFGASTPCRCSSQQPMLSCVGE